MRKNYLKALALVAGLLSWSGTTNAQYFSEGFESGTFPTGWVQTNVAKPWLIGAGTNYGPGAAHSGTKCAYFNEYNYASGTTSDMVTPNIDLTTATAPLLKFWYWDGSGTDVVKVLVSTDGVTYTLVSTTPSTVSSWTEYTINLSAYVGNATVKIAFRGTSTYGTTNPTVDDISVGEAPTCPAVTALTASAIGSNTTNISWTAGGSEASWNIQWGATGFIPGSGTEIGAATFPSTAYQITGLSPLTSYDIYVQADCSGGDLSTWYGPLHITTACAPVVAPWTETFQNGGTIPACWNQGTGNLENWKFANTGSGNHIGNNGVITGTTTSGGYFAWVDDSSPDNMGTTLQSPLIDISALTIPELSFYLISNNEGYSNVNFSINVFDGATWHNGFYTHNTNTFVGGWEKILVNLSSLTFTGNMQLRFVVDEVVSGDFYDDIAIDDIDIHEQPTCPAITGLISSTVSSATADITWTAGGVEGSWNIEWGAPGFTPGTGTEIGAATNPSTAYQITGLTANTNYDIYVQADCSGGDLATWKGPLSIYTGYCVFTGTSATKFINNFSTTGGTTNISNLASGFSVGGYNDATAMSVSQYATASVNFSAGVSGGTAGLNIWIDWNNNQVFDASEKVYASAAYITTTTGTITVPAATALGNYRMRIVSNTSSNNPVACGTSTGGEAEDYTFTVIAPPTCLPITALTLAGATDVTANISWTAGALETAWNIQWGAPGFIPGTGTEIGAASFPSTAYQITGLTANTNYDIYVQADCTGGDLSTWKGPLSIYTGYCIPNSTTNTSYYITGVSTVGALHNLNRTGTGLGTNGYSDYTATDTLTVYPGQQIDFTFSHPSSTYGYVAWVDWNNNFSFLDAGDQILASGYQSSPYTTSYTVPLTAPLTTTRLRIRNAYVSNPAPVCGLFNSGEAEDYIIKVISPPACLPVTALATTTVGTNTADITWTAGGTEVSWNIEWGTPGYAPGTGAEIGAASFPTTTYQITGLSPNTHYDVYVQANCTSDSSVWAGPLDVFTGYCSFVGTSPNYYINNFSTTGGLVNITNNNSGLAPNGYQNVSAMKVIQYDGGAPIGFNASFGGTYTYGCNIWVDWNKDLIFDNLTEKVYASGTYVSSATGSFSIPVGTAVGDYRMRVVATDTPSNPNPCGAAMYGEAEDYTVSVVLPPSCLPITNLTASNIYADSVSLTWTAAGVEPSWNVQWGLPGFNPGTGTEIGAASTLTTSYTVTGLNPSTDYYFYVQANCGSDSSFWALIPATTLCAPISALPWTENFDAMANVGVSVFPNCWINETGKWATYGTTPGQSYSAPNHVGIKYSSTDYLWTPEFNLTAGTTYEFAFRWIGDGSTGWNGGVYYSQSQSSTSSTQIGTNFITNTVVSSSTNYKKEIYCFTPTTTGVYSFGIFVSANSTPNNLSLDNFSLRIPSVNAGVSGATTVCQTGGLVDLNSIITINDTTGVWKFNPNPSAIQNDTLFNPAFLPSGTTNVYYVVGGCIPDSATATINIYPKSKAGTDGTISTCNYGPLNLFDGLTGSVDLGGQWYNPASQPISGSIVNFNGEIAANYNYIYVVSNGVCPNDTSVIEIQLQDCAGVDEYELKGFVLYPNPSNGIINIQYSGKGEDVKLDVVDSKGSIVWTKQIQFNDGTKQTIDLSTVENGVYYINMTAKDGGSVMKIVKN